MQVHQTKAKTKHEQCNTSSILVVIIYCFIGCNNQASTWYLTKFPDGSNLGSLYSRKKPTIILYTYINHHAESPNIARHTVIHNS